MTATVLSSGEQQQHIKDFAVTLAAGSLHPSKVWSMISAYFDESGTHDGSVAVAFGGYSATPEVWAAFTLEWSEVLVRHGLKYFHMAEYVARAKPFDRFDEQERISLMSSLIGVINRHDLVRPQQ